MHKTILIIIVLGLAIYPVYAFPSKIIKESANINSVTSGQLPTYTTGIEDGLNYKRFHQILADIIKIKKGKIGEILSKFLNNTSYWRWIIKEQVIEGDFTAQTKFTPDGALTILVYENMQDATNLSVARTMLHELVHAYLILYFNYDGVNASKDYPAIANAWAISKNPDYNKIQHDEIERSFIDEIASALVEYSNIVGLNIVDDYVYTDLAWAGLDFENNGELTTEIKQRIENRLLAELFNKPFGSEQPTLQLY